MCKKTLKLNNKNQNLVGLISEYQATLKMQKGLQQLCYYRSPYDTPGLNFINILLTAFTCVVPKSVKRLTNSLSLLRFWAPRV
jgi:hypothetical protein